MKFLFSRHNQYHARCGNKQPMSHLQQTCNHGQHTCSLCQGRALCELRELEEEAARLSSAIEEHNMAKRDLLADVVDAERQIMLLERKMQLEKEMQEMLDPTVGEGVVSTMRKEVHRMELRRGELQRQQEKLVQVRLGPKILSVGSKCSTGALGGWLVEMARYWYMLHGGNSNVCHLGSMTPGFIDMKYSLLQMSCLAVFTAIK